MAVTWKTIQQIINFSFKLILSMTHRVETKKLNLEFGYQIFYNFSDSKFIKNNLLHIAFWTLFHVLRNLIRSNKKEHPPYLISKHVTINGKIS